MDNNNILHYTLTLTAIGPVHIGSGEEISKKECLYLSNERKVYILDPMKVFNGMKKLKLLKDYEKFLLESSMKNFTYFVNDYKISPLEYKSWAAYILPLDNVYNMNESDNIMAFVKDPYGMPYIPGSSLKGAIRTAVQNTMIEKDRNVFKTEASQIMSEDFRNKRAYLSRQEKNISETLFCTLEKDKNRKGNAVNDIFQGLRISDSRPLSVEDLILCGKTDILPDGNPPKTSVPMKRECIKPGTKIVFDLDIDRSIIKLSDKSIYRAADSFYQSYRENFLSSFKKLDTTENAGEHLIYIGGGAGFATKTSVYSLYDSKEKGTSAVQKILVNTTSTKRKSDPHKHYLDLKKYHVSPHTRKCTKYRGNIYDMGLCSIDIR